MNIRLSIEYKKLQEAWDKKYHPATSKHIWSCLSYVDNKISFHAALHENFFINTFRLYTLYSQLAQEDRFTS